MKVVLFCGGLGMRLRDYSQSVPKPMVNIGYRPVLWHVMKYYAHFGHTDFILCLGYKADFIKDYFLNYDEAVSNDFVLSGGGSEIKLLNSDIHDWSITFVDTGVRTNIGGRLRAVAEHVQDDEMFLANYSDTLTDLPLDDMVSNFRESDAIATFACVNPGYSFHVVSLEDDNKVSNIEDVRTSQLWINGGYFVLRREIFDYMNEGEELVHEPFARLISERKLMAYRFDSFWRSMETFKDKQELDELYAEGRAPWEVWKRHPEG